MNCDKSTDDSHVGDWDNVRYGSNMLRPVMKGTDLEVHKIAIQVWKQNIPTKSIVDDYYLKSGVTEIADYETAEDMISDKENDNLPVTITENDINSVLEYAHENRDLIENIIEEDNKLKSILFDENGGLRESMSIKSDLNETDFDYYEVKFDNNERGFSISWDQNSID